MTLTSLFQIRRPVFPDTGVGDVDGDGRAEVALVETHLGAKGTAGGRQFKIALLNGFTGEAIWIQQIPGVVASNSLKNPVRLRMGDAGADGKRHVFVCIHGDGRDATLAVFDHAGQAGRLHTGPLDPTRAPDDITRVAIEKFAAAPAKPPLLRDRTLGASYRIDSNGDRTVSQPIIPAANSLDRPEKPTRLASARQKDPRYLRSLPWAGMAQAMPEVLLSAILSLLLLVLPATVLRVAVTRRQWSLKWFLALPIACAVVFGALRWLSAEGSDITEYVSSLKGPFVRGRWETSDALRSVTGLLLLAVQGLPFVLCFGIVLLSAVQRQRRRLIVWLLVFLIATLGGSAVILWDDSWHVGTPHHYSWEGWHWMWFHGACITGILVGLSLLIGPIVRRTARWFRSRLKPSLPL